MDISVTISTATCKERDDYYLDYRSTRAQLGGHLWVLDLIACTGCRIWVIMKYYAQGGPAHVHVLLTADLILYLGNTFLHVTLWFSCRQNIMTKLS